VLIATMTARGSDVDLSEIRPYPYRSTCPYLARAVARAIASTVAQSRGSLGKRRNVGPAVDCNGGGGDDKSAMAEENRPATRTAQRKTKVADD
jgi:hypothetical protein